LNYLIDHEASYHTSKYSLFSTDRKCCNLNFHFGDQRSRFGVIQVTVWKLVPNIAALATVSLRSLLLSLAFWFAFLI